MRQDGHKMICRIVPEDAAQSVRVIDIVDEFRLMQDLHALGYTFPLVVLVELWWVCPKLGAVRMYPAFSDDLDTLREMMSLHETMEAGDE